jgi:hypothetical protein
MGRFDLVFQNPRDVDKYVKYTAHPITPEVMTGFGTLIESAVLSGDVRLREDMGPFQLEIISLPPTVTESTLTRYFNAKGLDFCGLAKRATKSRTNKWTVGFEYNMPDRLDATHYASMSSNEISPGALASSATTRTIRRLNLITATSNAGTATVSVPTATKPVTWQTVAPMSCLGTTKNRKLESLKLGQLRRHASTP